MKIRLIYWLTAVALFLIFIAYLAIPKKVMQEEFGSVLEQSEYIVVSEEDRAVIREIITTLVHTQLTVLPFKKGYMESLGKKLVGRVNTFEFLAVIFTEPDLVADMKILQKSTFKYKKFTEGLQPKLLKDYQKAGFYQRVTKFSKHLRLDEAEFMTILNHCLDAAKREEKVAFLPMMDYLISD